MREKDERGREWGTRRKGEAMKGTHEDRHTADVEGDVGDELHVGLARGFT